MRLIAVDIGNSSINIGFFSNQGLSVHRITNSFRKSTEEYIAEIKIFLEKNLAEKSAEGVIISSVAPGLTPLLREALRGLISKEPLVVNYKMNTGLSFSIDNPEKLGADRIANAVAAYEHYGSATIVVDFGTATAVSVVDKDARFLGGAILPGVGLMSESLAKGTAQLPEVNIGSHPSALGTETARCIQSGLLYGTAGAVERIIDEIKKEAGLEFKVIITGGYANLISSFLRIQYEFLPYLTLEGLKILYLKNENART